MTNNAIVIIMAGGMGKRMNSTIPKVLHPINGTPMLVHVIKEAEMIAPFKILVVVGKYKDAIKKTVEEGVNNSNIVYVTQETPLGTGHAIQCCVPEMMQYGNADTKVVVLSGDVPLLHNSTITSLISGKSSVSIITTHLENPSGYGRVIEIDGRVVGIVEEKDCNTEQKKINQINGGIYCFNCDMLCKRLSELSNANAQKEYYLTDMIGILRTKENARVTAMVLSESQQYQIMGVNTPDQLRELEKISKL
jgi:UDP-N-acetylglucosamine diphosphorylase/glucosamine-1-phosphate N-acetyltransferase